MIAITTSISINVKAAERLPRCPICMRFPFLLAAIAIPGTQQC